MDSYDKQPEQLEGLAVLIDADGLAGHEASVQAVARRARSLVPVAASVLGDAREPLVARLRAFAVVTAALRSESDSQVRAAA